MSLTRERFTFEASSFASAKAALGFVNGDAGGFFDQSAAVHGARIKDLADAALLDDGVRIGAEAHAHEEFLNVAKTSYAAVDEIFTLSGAIEAAAHDDFAGLDVDSGLVLRALFPVLVGFRRGFVSGRDGGFCDDCFQFG